ncbi:MAG: nucleic acid-binding protein [Segetibacter sp.]|nr:nucleic acid-binding protein [Segetibacter sp.]
MFIPFSVATELKTLIPFGYNISFLQEQNKYIIRKPVDIKLIQDLCEYIDIGEAEAIALAKELNADLLLIDEKLGKQFAEAEHIYCKGVVGILIEAKKEGLLESIKPLLDDLINTLKFRLSDKIYKLALQKAGEAIIP